MKKNKYKLIKNNNFINLKNNYNVIVIFKFFDSYVLIKNIFEYNFLSFTTENIENETIINEIKRYIKINLSINYEGILKQVESNQFFYVFSSSIDSIELQNIKECVDLKIFKYIELKENKKNDILEIVDACNLKDYSNNTVKYLLIILIILSTIVFVTFGIFIYKLIKGEIDFELLFILIGLFLLFVFGLYDYIKK